MSPERNIPGNSDLRIGKSGKTKVAVIWTGGTIASVARQVGDNEVSMPGYTGEMFQKRVLGDAFTAKNEFTWIPADPENPRGIDSTESQNRIMEMVVQRIYETLANPGFKNHRVVVTHGTDTLVHTASLASLSIQGLDRPVVITGSQKRPGALGSDALSNFDLAIRAAALPTNQVLVAFGNSVMRGVAATKLEAVETRDTFGSQHQDLVAQLIASDLRINHEMLAVPQTTGDSLKYFPGMDGRVRTAQFAPNMYDEWMMRKTLDPDFDAVILEGYAAGNIPTGVADIIREMSEKMMIIITPSTATHGSKETLYAGSAEIAHPSTTHFVGSTHVALTKFQWLFNQGKKLGLKNLSHDRALLKWVKDRFSLDFAGENGRKGSTADVPADLYLHTVATRAEIKTKYDGIPLVSDASDTEELRLKNFKLMMIDEKLEFLAEKFIKEGKLDPMDKDEWLFMRKGIEVPVEWLLGYEHAAGDILYEYMMSPRIIPRMKKPMRHSGGKYMFDEELYELFGVRRPEDAPVPNESDFRTDLSVLIVPAVPPDMPGTSAAQ